MGARGEPQSDFVSACAKDRARSIRERRAPLAATLALLLAGVWTWPAPACAQAIVTIDVTADVHPISPLIYGMNFADAPRFAGARVPLTRWGGNATSRYNYQIDTSNTGSDYYFENIPGCWSSAANYCNPPTSDPLNQSGANAYLDQAAHQHAVALLTVPTLGWVARPPPRYNHPFECGCPRTANANQDSFDPYDSNCGNGKSGGSWITCPAATGTSISVDASWSTQWGTYLNQKFGAANGNRIYELDNEPALWSSTHHDVHPARLGYDELWQRMRDNAVALLASDPTAQIAGPVEWGWPNYFCSDLDDISKGCTSTSTDRAKHGGEELVAWLLDQAHAYETQNGKRILHYLDLHYYPQGGSPPDDIRSLWDKSYTDPSWINDKIYLIPRMHDWVNQHYPGTRLLVSEYDFYQHDGNLGAVTYAEVLGVFGREGLDAATAWSPPDATQGGFAAFALYTNYDGKGGHFEANNARATVTGGSGIQAYAAASVTRSTIALVNEGSSPATIAVHFAAGFTPGTSAEWYTHTTGATIARQADVAIAAGVATVTLGAQGVGLLVVPGVGTQVTYDMAEAPIDASGEPPDFALAAPGDAAPAPGADATLSTHDAAPPGDAAATGTSAPSGCTCTVGACFSARAPLPTLALAALLAVALLGRSRRRARR